MPQQNQWPHFIGEYLRYLVAIGRPQTTVRLRRDQLRHLARSINLQPGDITHDARTGARGTCVPSRGYSATVRSR
jgi:hypothetical protein